MHMDIHIGACVATAKLLEAEWLTEAAKLKQAADHFQVADRVYELGSLYAVLVDQVLDEVALLVRATSRLPLKLGLALGK